MPVNFLSTPIASKTKAFQMFKKPVIRFMMMLSIYVGCSLQQTRAGNFTASGSTLTIDLDVASQIVTVVSTGTTYTFTLSGGATNTWTGTTSSSVTVSGAVLTVTATGLSTFSTINITDSQTGNGVTFATSGANAYSDNFNITLDNDPSQIVFNGSSSFTESNSFSITTTKNVSFSSLSSLSTVNGNLTLSANMQTIPNNFAFSGIKVDSATVQVTGTGILTMSARGGTGANTTYLNCGIAVVNGGMVKGGTTGTTTITGYGYTGFAGTSSNTKAFGVLLAGKGASTPATISSNGSNVLVTGYGANSTATTGSSAVYHTGVSVGYTTQNITLNPDPYGLITSGGNGTVTVNGYGGTCASLTSGTGILTYCHGVAVGCLNQNINGGIITSGGAGKVTVTGTGGGPDTLAHGNNGVHVLGVITSGTNADLEVVGYQGTTKTTDNLSSGEAGVNVYYGIIRAGSGTGTTRVVGTGVSSAFSNFYSSIGVNFGNGGIISSLGSGSVTVIGTAYNSTRGYNHGVNMSGTNSLISSISSNGGDVVVEGRAGGFNTSSNYGVYVSYGSFVSAGGNGNVNVTGYGGNNTGTSGSSNHGVNIDAGINSATAYISSSGGNVTVTGIGGGGNSSSPAASSSASNIGVWCKGGYISAGGLGTVTVNGTGGNTSPGGTGTGGNHGVVIASTYIKSGSAYTPTITSSGGNIIITGNGGGSGNSNHGVVNLGLIKPMRQGTLSITGTGGTSSGNSNYGILNDGAPTVNSVVYPATITSDSASVTLNGTGGGKSLSNTNVGVYLSGGTAPNGSRVTSGGGNVSVTAIEGLNTGTAIAMSVSSPATITTATNGGDITIKANSFTLTGTVSASSSDSINFIPFTNKTPLQFSSASDTRGILSFSAAEITNITGGHINIGNDSTGEITASVAISPDAGSNLKLTGSSLSPKVTGTSFTMASGKILDLSGVDTLTINITGTTLNTQYDQLKVIAGLTLTGINLKLSGTYSPVGCDVFTILDATSITGTFNGLPNGASLSFNDKTLIINYTSTQVTLTNPAPKITSQPLNQTVVAGNTASFSAAFCGNSTPTIQWQASTDGGISWSNIPGATTGTLSFTATYSQNGYKGRAVVTNSYGTDTTNVVTLTVTCTPTGSTETASACVSYTWHGTTYTTSGTKTWTGTNAEGCDSTVTLNLTINQSSTSTTTQTATGSYSWNGATYTSSGTYTWTGTNSVNCDSVATLILTINSCTPTTSTDTISACASYIWHGTAYTTSNNTATWVTTNAGGCDSTVTLNLTINSATSSTENQLACDSYVWHGTTYTTSGAKTWTGTNAAGCDSVVTLNLTINSATSSTETTSACGSYVWHGTTYTSSNNTAIWTGTNAAGCDSVVTLNLTINSTTSSTETASACGSYVWHGTTYTTSGVKTWTGTNAANCDSVVTLQLTLQTVVPTKPASITQTLVSNTCGARVYRYSASVIASGLQYVWLLPTTLGGDTSAILLDSGTINSKTILVRYVSNNGASTTDSIRVASYNGCTSTYTAAKLIISSMKVPAAPSTFTGVAVDPAACGARTYRITAPTLPTATSAVPAATGYVWSFVGNLSNYITIDSGTVNSQVIVIKCSSNEGAAVGDSIKLCYTSVCGNSPWKAVKMTIVKLSAPSAPTLYSSNSLVSNECGARVYRYSASALTSGNNYSGTATGYLWSFTGNLGVNAVIDSGTINSQTIKVRFTSNAAAATDDSVRVAFTSGCGNSEWKSAKLTNTLLDVPAAPASVTITLVSDICGARVYRYTTPALTVASTTRAAATGYLWSTPFGTVGATGVLDSGSLSGQTIKIRYSSNDAALTGDSIKVQYTSGCGNSLAKAQKLSNVAAKLLAAPTSLAGNTNICSIVGTESSTRYTSTAVTGAVSYLWTIPSGAVIDSGSNGLKIKVRFITAGPNDSIYVQAIGTNGCAGAKKILKLVTTSCATVPTSKVSNLGTLSEALMQVNVYPNPSSTNFNLQVLTTGKDMVTARILDLQGRLIKSFVIAPNRTMNIGSMLKSGTYFVEVKQGKEVKTTKLIKF